MENLTAVIIVGVYTITYVVVFFIQKSYIEKVKMLNDTITNYMGIFDIKKVKEYADMRDETTKMKYEKFIENFKPSEEEIKQMFNDGYEKFKEHVNKQVTEEFEELALFAAYTLSYTNKQNIEAIKDRFLPKTKEYFSDDVLELLKNKT